MAERVLCKQSYPAWPSRSLVSLDDSDCEGAPTCSMTHTAVSFPARISPRHPEKLSSRAFIFAPWVLARGVGFQPACLCGRPAAKRLAPLPSAQYISHSTLL